ncbi:uncharacterized protein LOC131601500 isoform X2 [Vicia villosa]|nr:uncharacterized protein LOC131601500 isoform X2 [Vicia villosa]
MEQIQEQMAEMRAQLMEQMNTQMTQFMEALANVTRGQEDLRVLVENSRRTENVGGQYGLYDDVSGRIENNHDENEFRQPAHVPYNPFNQNQGFPPPPPSRLLGGRGHHNRGNQDFDFENVDQLSRHSAEGVQDDGGKIRLIEERLRAVEGKGVLGMDITDLGLVPGVRVPPKFKVPIFDKYNGATCPMTHVKAYYRKMSVYSEDEGFLMHFFQDSLAGASLEWYVQLERTHIHSWRDLVEAFIKHYQYNVDMAPNRTQLQSLVQGSKDSFKEYAQKWRELAARVQPPMTEREMIDMFTSTLSGHYYLACSASANFSEMVRYGERVEMGLKMGKIQLGASSNTPSGKKQTEGYARRKEGNADAIYGRRGSGRNNSQVNAFMIPVPQQQQHLQGHRSNNDRYPPRTRPHRKIDPIPMTYAQVLQHLLKIEKITLRDAPNAPDTQSPNYNVNVRCAFHSGAAGHDTERCIALKNKVQDLLDQKIIQFTPTPNIVNNPMPTHGGSGVNAIESEETSVVSDVGCLTFPLVSVKQHLVNSGIFPGCGVDCENCKSRPEGCADLKSMVQKLIDEGPLQFYRRSRGAKSESGEVSVISIPYEPVVPICIQVPIQIPVSIPYEEQPAALMITVPGPIPYESEKAIPWHYGSDVYYYGTKEEGELSEEKSVEAAVANTDNFAGTGRITRSGRVFSPQPIQNNADALAKAKGKQVVTDVQNSPIHNGPPDSAVPSKDVEELLRIIKKSDYKVVEQLGQTQSKISILQLLMCSEGHRDALLRILNGAYVPHEISVNQLEAVANNISAGNGLGFTDHDLPPEGRNHNKALHISIECKGTTLSRVLVDTGSSLNMLPKSALMRIDYAGVELRPSELVVRAFDGSRRSVFGEVDLPIQVGPQIFTTTFYVMDIQPAYCCLLGRPWIHKAGAVTSTLHQKLKYPVDGKVVTVCGEEDYIVSHLSSFQYVEIEGEIHETPFQAFEAVNAVKTPLCELKKPETIMSSLKDAQVVVETGKSEGWGQMIDVRPKFNKNGLGFNPGRQSFTSPTSSFTPVRFVRGGVIQDGKVNAIVKGEEVDSDCDFDSWIRPSIPGTKLNNWTIEDVIQVTQAQECSTTTDSIGNSSAIAYYDFDNPIYQAEEEAYEDCDLPDELARLLKQEEKKVIQPHQEAIEMVNVGTKEQVREVKIGAALENSVKRRLIAMLKEYADIFAWSYEDMPGLDTNIVVHRLPLKEDSPPVK